jgi:hypothetical protein
MKPLVSMNDIRPWENEFARDDLIADVLDTCLNTDILPNRAAHPFRFSYDPAQGSMYVSRRRMQGPAVHDSRDRDFPYEEVLSRMFWQGAAGDDDGADRRRLCVLGPTGCGKSTFVDFFLRWYCPEKSAHAADFARQVTVWFDANAAKDNERLNQTFFSSAQAWIRTACRQKGVDIDELVRRRQLPKQNAESWVQFALEEVSALAAVRGSGIEYLVIFVDNMDQCPIRVQQRLLSTIENWLEMPTLRIWRVILTMWPSTYETLKHSTLNMMRNWKLLRLGVVNPETLMGIRRGVIAGRIAKLYEQTAGAGSSHRSVHERFRSFVDASLGLWSQRLAGSIAEGNEPDDDSSVTSAGGLVRDLCNGDLRRELGLLHGFMFGEGAYRIWHQDKSTTGPARRRDYEILESLILGRHDHMLHSADHVGNLFMLGHQHRMPRDLLIGPHMLHLLRGGATFHEYQALCRAMTGLGYAEDNVEYCFHEFRRLGILHEVRSERPHGVGYEGHPSVITAYHRLLYDEPAYLDCVAPVTAADDECRAEMRAARAAGDAFARKVGCSLAFLRFLRRMEAAFCDGSKINSAARAGFASKLEPVAIPCLWQHLATRYRQRLVGLRTSGYLAHLPSDWWDDAVQSQVLVEAPLANRKLSCAGSA